MRRSKATREVEDDDAIQPIVQPTPEQIADELKRLREMIEADSTPSMDGRVAQAIEYGIRWATEKTAGWAKPAEEAQALSRIIQDEMK